MKRYCLLFLIVCACNMIAYCNLVKVTMKNGSSITGTYKELDPTSHITIVMANHDVVILMSEVLNIEELNESSYLGNNKQIDEIIPSSKNDTNDISDYDSHYPDYIKVVLGGEEITMLLVRGGTFNMGYDGWHSRSYNSEPVHKVTISPFYVSKNYLSMAAFVGIYNNFSKNNNSISKKNNKAKVFRKWDEINNLLTHIGQPFRLITEAEWEYVSTSPLANYIFDEQNKTRYLEWCSDLFGDYEPYDQINPKGASQGKYHVLRKFSKDNDKFHRYSSNKLDQKDNTIMINEDNEAYIRLVVDAKDAININQ